jgi:hypothetical protein
MVPAPVSVTSLGDVSTLKPAYNNGDYWRHPAGHLYVMRDGIWVYVPPEEEPKS